MRFRRMNIAIYGQANLNQLDQIGGLLHLLFCQANQLLMIANLYKSGHTLRSWKLHSMWNDWPQPLKTCHNVLWRVHSILPHTLLKNERYKISNIPCFLSSKKTKNVNQLNNILMLYIWNLAIEILFKIAHWKV